MEIAAVLILNGCTLFKKCRGLLTMYEIQVEDDWEMKRTLHDTVLCLIRSSSNGTPHL